MNKIILTTLMLAGLAMAFQPIAAYADDASEYVEESYSEEQVDDGAVTDEATDPAVDEQGYEESAN